MPSLALVSALFLGVAAIMLAAAAYRARDLIRPPRTPDLFALVLTLAALAVSFAVQAPIARAAEDLLATNLGQLLGNGTTLLAAFAATAMVLFIVEDDGARAKRGLHRRLALLTVALLTMVVLFVTNPTAAEEFTSPDAPLGILAYYFAYLIYLALALVDLFTLVKRYAGRTTDGYLRIGLRIVAIGCIVGLIYTAGRTVNLTIARVVDGVGDPVFGLLEFLVAAVLPAIAVLLLTIGITFRRWAPALVRPVQSILQLLAYRRSYRRLEPLWEAMNVVLPELAFRPRDSATRPRLRLYGRVVELHDAELAVGPFVDTQVRIEAEAAAIESGLSGEEAAATVDAVVLAVGLEALRNNRAVASRGQPRRLRHSRPGDIDLRREASRLERVSSAFVRSPIVEQFAASSIPADS